VAGLSPSPVEPQQVGAVADACGVPVTSTPAATAATTAAPASVASRVFQHLADNLALCTIFPFEDQDADRGNNVGPGSGTTHHVAQLRQVGFLAIKPGLSVMGITSSAAGGPGGPGSPSTSRTAASTMALTTNDVIFSWGGA
jgi:hypothetical protein